MKWPKFQGQFVFNYVYLIPLSIFIAKLLEILFNLLGWLFITPKDQYGNSFVSNFIEWFGVLYGILLPLILVRVWEQLDDIDREFDREADAVMILYEDTLFLGKDSSEFRQKIHQALRDYVVHVIKHYPEELKVLQNNGKQTAPEKKGGNTILEQMENGIKNFFRSMAKNLSKYIKLSDKPVVSDEQRIKGDEILQQIRKQFQSFIRSRSNWTKENEFLIPELINRLNEIVDIRGDRIAIASQRLFDTLRYVALITSIIFVLPFYFVSFSFSDGLLDNLLVVGVTLLTVFLYLIIEDFDEPFKGTWRIDSKSWQRVLDYMDHPERERELENLDTDEQQGIPLPNAPAESNGSKATGRVEQKPGFQKSGQGGKVKRTKAKRGAEITQDINIPVPIQKGPRRTKSR